MGISFEKPEITFESSEGESNIQVYPHLIWTPSTQIIMENEMIETIPNVLYPSRRDFRRLIGDSTNFVMQSADVKEEMKKYDAICENIEQIAGINYRKLLSPFAVFRHQAPRSIMSLFHLVMLDASEDEK